ncbi:MAG: hypothetical protein M3Y87_02610 [Myxococcota bacterium]|nr:hypothetical protein [Myxococcota bacterium]
MRPLRFLPFCAALVVAACGGDPAVADDASARTDAGPIEVGDPLAWALSEPGPFSTGYQSWEHTYRPAGQSADRTIRIHVWYPTLDATGTPAMYAGLVRDRASFVGATPAAPAHASGELPVHVFSHGHRGFGGVAHFLHRRFASHGWVTIAPDHTGNTILDNVEPRPVALWYLRSLDVTAALDAVAAGGAGVPSLGPLDTERVLLTGHSFGAHTVWASAGAAFDADVIAAGRCTTETPCTEAELDVFRAGVGDPRIVAAIPMAGLISSEWFGAGGHASVAIPLLAMTGSTDPNTMSGAEAQNERAAALDFTWFDVEGACHEFFGLGCDDEAGEQERIVAAPALALGRRHVLGDESEGTLGVLDGTVAVSERVTVRRGDSP